MTQLESHEYPTRVTEFYLGTLIGVLTGWLLFSRSGRFRDILAGARNPQTSGALAENRPAKVDQSPSSTRHPLHVDPESLDALTVARMTDHNVH